MNTLDEVPEENVFQPEDIDRKVYDILDSMLFNVPYDEAKVHNLQNAICERIMKTLIEGNLNYKYVSSIYIT